VAFPRNKTKNRVGEVKGLMENSREFGSRRLSFCCALIAVEKDKLLSRLLLHFGILLGENAQCQRRKKGGCATVGIYKRAPNEKSQNSLRNAPPPT